MGRHLDVEGPPAAWRRHLDMARWRPRREHVQRNLDVRLRLIIRPRRVLDPSMGSCSRPGRVLPDDRPRPWTPEGVVRRYRSRSGPHVSSSGLRSPLSGSIGTQTLDSCAPTPTRTGGRVGVGSSVETIIAQALEFRPRLVAVADAGRRAEVAAALPFAEVVDDLTALVEVADVVVNGVVGFAGLPVTVATLTAGKRLALANKESLIAAGPVVQPLRATPGAELIPVDSEHCAVHQCMRASIAAGREVSRIVLTASGGPFRGLTADALRSVSIDDALAHPTWAMGPKITVDSSTLMNKGLEVIEAHELFGTPYDQIEVVVHPQSVVHSMVEYIDARRRTAQHARQTLPIGYALAYPQRSARRSGASMVPLAARLRDSRHGDVPVPPARLRGGPDRRQCASLAERRQRGRGRGVPGRSDQMEPDS